MNIKKLSLFLVLSVLLITAIGCDSNRREKLIEFNDTSEQEKAEIIEDSRKNYNAYTSLMTLDGSYLYAYGMRMDLVHKIIGYDCDIIGCKHVTDICEVPARRDRTFQHSQNGGMYYAVGKDIYFEKDEQKTLIYQNRYASSFAVDTYDVPETVTGFIPYNNDQFIVLGYNTVSVLDTKSGSCSEPIEIGDMTFDSLALLDEKTLAICNMNMELYMVDLKTETVEKIGDYVMYVQTDGSMLYYISICDGQYGLMQYDLNTKAETLIAEDVASFCVSQTFIIYTKQDEETKLYELNLDTLHSEIVYTLDLSQAGTNGRITNILYFPGYENYILEISPEPAKPFFEYVLLDMNTWEYEYISCEL